MLKKLPFWDNLHEKMFCSIRRIFQVFTIYELEMLKRLQFWNNLHLKDIPSVDYSIMISYIRAISVKYFSFVIFHMLRYSSSGIFCRFNLYMSNK